MGLGIHNPDPLRAHICCLGCKSVIDWFCQSNGQKAQKGWLPKQQISIRLHAQQRKISLELHAQTLAFFEDSDTHGEVQARGQKQLRPPNLN